MLEVTWEDLSNYQMIGGEIQEHATRTEGISISLVKR